MIHYNPEVASWCGLGLSTCLLYREIQRAVLTVVFKLTEPPVSTLPLVSARLAVRGLIEESKAEDLGDIGDVDHPGCHAPAPKPEPIYDAEFIDLDDRAKQYAKWDRESKAFWDKHEGRPVVRQEDGKPLMYLDALAGSAQGAWMDRDREGN